MTVLRNGKLRRRVADRASCRQVELVSKMLGRELETLEALERAADGAADALEAATPVLEAHGVGRRGAIAPFDLRPSRRGRRPRRPARLGPHRDRAAALRRRPRRHRAARHRRQPVAVRSPAHGDRRRDRVLPREPPDRGPRRRADGAREHRPRAAGRARLDAADPAPAAGRAGREVDRGARHPPGRPERRSRHAQRRQPAEGAARPLARSPSPSS